MVIGTQHLSGADWPHYQALAQLGVRHVSANPPGDWRTWTAPVLGDFKARLAELGIALDMVLLPLSSAAAPLNGAPHVFLGPPAERDRELDQICELIRNLSLAGIGAARYNAAFLGHFRTPDRLGRGGARLSSFVYDQLGGDPRSGPGPEHLARQPRDQAAWLEVAAHGPLSADDVWERIDTFLARVVPAAEEYRVRLACHPEDPGIGDRSYYGFPRVLGTVAGLKQFVTLHESPYHGLNFCVGTVAEMLEKPAEEIGEIVRYFGQRGKLFNIHFRNIRGGLWDFVETFPDEGDMNMRAVLQVLQEVRYDYMVMPDHVPQIDGAAPQHVGFAFCFGYIRALMQTLDIREP
jgi:mannonate dehydratase